MPLVVFNWTTAAGAPQQSYLDATVRQNHVASAQVTSKRVEKGANVTDHIRPMPPKLTLEGVVTNTPILDSPALLGYTTATVQNNTQPFQGGPFSVPSVVSFKALTFLQQFDRVGDVFKAIVSAIAESDVFKITTALQTYDNMACANFSVPVDVATGSSIQFTIDFEQLVFATTESSAVAAKQTVKHKAHQAPQEATAQQSQQLQSTLSALFK